MKLGIMQPYLFLYIGYFQLLHAVDRFVVYDDVMFIKQGWINRNRILINGKPSFFSVPVKHASSFTCICDTLIGDGRPHERWSEKLLKTFDNAYRQAPEFARVFPMIESVFARQTTRVADLARASLKVVADFLNIHTGWIDSSTQYSNAHLHGEDRVLAICKAEGAEEYVNASGGKELYSRKRFEIEGVRLRFIEPKPIQYRQFGPPFVPWLSIIDVLMFNSRETVQGYLDAFDLD